MPVPANSGITLLERAAVSAREYGNLPPHADAILGMLALSIIAMVRTSPDDEADRLEQISRAARRR